MLAICLVGPGFGSNFSQRKGFNNKQVYQISANTLLRSAEQLAARQFCDLLLNPSNSFPVKHQTQEDKQKAVKLFSRRV